MDLYLVLCTYIYWDFELSSWWFFAPSDYKKRLLRNILESGDYSHRRKKELNCHKKGG
jgi:hypothetical protein